MTHYWTHSLIHSSAEMGTVLLLLVAIVIATCAGHEVEKRRIVAGDLDLSTYEIQNEVSCSALSTARHCETRIPTHNVLMHCTVVDTVITTTGAALHKTGTNCTLTVSTESRL